MQTTAKMIRKASSAVLRSAGNNAKLRKEKTRRQKESFFQAGLAWTLAIPIARLVLHGFFFLLSLVVSYEYAWTVDPFSIFTSDWTGYILNSVQGIVRTLKMPIFSPDIL